MRPTVRQLLLLSLWLIHGHAFLPLRRSQLTTAARTDAETRILSLQLSSSSAFVVPVAELEKNLTSSERSVTGVVRSVGPSVAFVLSVWPAMTGSRRTPRPTSSTNSPPQGQSLGSGSGFLVESDGYVVTNYHVIERAYQIQSMQRQIQDQIEAFVQNVTCDQNGRLMANLLLRTTSMQPPPPKVYCRINSASEYEACRIVQVQPDLDVAVLKIENSTTSSWPTAAFGASSDLLVGQSLVAIGNPFGLDQTVTSGVVSALNREISTSTSQTIRNCIQTDAAINPGNSGGPLLNLAGEVVGVNTAIVTTSGSNAGIGFAIPSDKVKPVVRDMIRTDRAKRGVRPKAGYLGIGIVKATLNKPGNWILTVEPDSPAAEAGLKALQVLPTGQILYGDAVVAVAGNFVANYDDLTKEIENRVEGEELSLTLEDGVTGERRVAYIKLGSRPQA